MLYYVLNVVRGGCTLNHLVLVVMDSVRKRPSCQTTHRYVTRPGMLAGVVGSTNHEPKYREMGCDRMSETGSPAPPFPCQLRPAMRRSSHRESRGPRGRGEG